MHSHELDEIFDNDLHYDNYGNVDYTVILNSDLFVTMERQRFRKAVAGKGANLDMLERAQDGEGFDKLTDNRKVVVEDFIYIDDLEILVYTTLYPKTSTIFVTHTKKQERSSG